MSKVQKYLSKSRKLADECILNPSRLTLARKRKGLTKLAFASKIGVDRKTLHAYESGSTVPSEATISNILAVLEFPKDFLCGEDIEEPTVYSGSFRSMSKMTAPQRDMALSQAAFGLHLSTWINKKFELPKPQIPDLGREPDPEAASEYVRRKWGLGTMSVRNMVHLLEANGVRVFSLAVDAREVDAFSLWTGGVPFIFLNSNKSSEHSRFDAAHELGHLVLHKHGSPQGIEAEKQANSFASAFLMPRGSVIASAPAFPTYMTLVTLKRKWIVSVGALAYRLHALNLMTDWQYRGVAIEIAKRGRSFEPNQAQRETSAVLPKIFGVLFEEGITRSQIARELSLPISELEQLLFGLAMTGIVGGGKRTPFQGKQLTLVE